MCQFNQKIIRIYNGILTTAVKKPFRFQGNVLIHRKICQNQIICAIPFSSSGTSGLLPEGCSGSGISYKYRCIDLSDIDSKFQCIGRYKSGQFAGNHALFDIFSFLRGVTASVSGYLFFFCISQKAAVLQLISGFFHKDLYVFSGFCKRQKALFFFHQLWEQIGCNAYHGFFSIRISISVQFFGRLDQAVGSLCHACPAFTDTGKCFSTDFFGKLYRIGNRC